MLAADRPAPADARLRRAAAWRRSSRRRASRRRDAAPRRRAPRPRRRRRARRAARRLLAAMHSPQTLRRGKACRSTRATDQPARASRIAAAEPAGPAPTMATSKRRRHAVPSPPPRATRQCVNRPSSYFVEAPRRRGDRPARPSDEFAGRRSRRERSARASLRVTALAPRKKIRWLAASAKRLRRGSHAANASARARARREQRGERVGVEVVEEQVGDDDVPALAVRGRPPTQDVGDRRLRAASRRSA